MDLQAQGFCFDISVGGVALECFGPMGCSGGADECWDMSPVWAFWCGALFSGAGLAVLVDDFSYLWRQAAEAKAKDGIHPTR